MDPGGPKTYGSWSAKIDCICFFKNCFILKIIFFSDTLSNQGFYQDSSKAWILNPYSGSMTGFLMTSLEEARSRSRIIIPSLYHVNYEFRLWYENIIALQAFTGQLSSISAQSRMLCNSQLGKGEILRRRIRATTYLVIKYVKTVHSAHSSVWG